MVMTCSVDVSAAILSHFLVQQRHFSAKNGKKWDPRGLQVAFLAKKGNLQPAAGDRWGPLGIARVARDGSGLTTSKVTAGHVAAVHGHVSRIALLVVSHLLIISAPRTGMSVPAPVR